MIYFIFNNIKCSNIFLESLKVKRNRISGHNVIIFKYLGLKNHILWSINYTVWITDNILYGTWFLNSTCYWIHFMFKVFISTFSENSPIFVCYLILREKLDANLFSVLFVGSRKYLRYVSPGRFHLPSLATMFNICQWKIKRWQYQVSNC